MLIILTDVHVASGKHKQKQVPGCILPHEREGWAALLKAGTENALVDVWRELHPTERKVFTYVYILR
jgi:exonuclease III